MSRLDRLTADNLYGTLMATRGELDELKGLQRVSGLSGIETFLTESTDTWDVIQTITSGQTLNIICAWEGDRTQIYPLMESFGEVFFFGTTSIWRMLPDGDNYSVGGNTVNMTQGRADLDLAYTERFIYVVKCTAGSMTIHFKGHIYATCPGTVAFSTLVA